MPSERFLNAVAEYIEKCGGKQAYAERRLHYQTDLKAMSIDLFHRDVYPRTHDPIFRFFLKKKPFAPAFDKNSEYTLGQFHDAIGSLAPLTQRKGELLYPRGTYKSSFDADDTCQYIVCYPDIRILIMVGESSLGEAFVPEIKRRFILEDAKEPTEFQLLFPDFVIDQTKVNGEGKRDPKGSCADQDKGGAQEYWCPARRLDQKEPTLGSLSILGSTSGWHADVMKADDVITDTTPISTGNARAKIVSKFVGVINLLEQHSILEVIGTRYHLEDLYDHIKTTLPNIRYVCASSWTVLPHAVNVKPRDLREQDVVLLFPERQGFAYLKEKLLLDLDTFYCQQQNDPSKGGPMVRFKIEDLRARTAKLPEDPNHARYNFWDVATTASDGSDWSVGVFISIDTVRWIAYVHRMVIDKWTPNELAFQIAKLARETDPQMVTFESYTDSNKAWLEQEVIKHAVSMNYQIPLKTQKTDKTKKAKGYRIAGLEPLILGGRLFFSNMIIGIDELYKQFCDFTGEPTQKRHDDIPDAISFLRLVMPMTGLNLQQPNSPTQNAGMTQTTNEAQNAIWVQAHRLAAAQRIFLTQREQQPQTAAPTVKEDSYFPQ